MTDHTKLSRDEMIAKIEKLTLACTAVRLAFEQVLSRVYEGESIGEKDVDHFIGVLVIAETNAPISEAQLMAASPSNQTITDLASIINSRPTDPAVIH